MKKVKQKKCVCGTEFIPTKPLQKYCTIKCVPKKTAKVKPVKPKSPKPRPQQPENPTRVDYVRILQIVFNQYIRLRDANKRCVSCGKINDGRFDAGHFLPVSTHPQLRFNEQNVHGQCRECNSYKNGNVVAYEKGLIYRIGEEAVARLRAAKNPQKPCETELKTQIARYKAKIKELQACIL
jgi:hypothetical protein